MNKKSIEKTTQILVQVFASSKGDFCNPLCNNLPKYDLKNLRSMQIQSPSQLYAPTSMTTSEWITFKILFLIFKALRNQYPSFIQDLVTRSLLL